MSDLRTRIEFTLAHTFSKLFKDETLCKIFEGNEKATLKVFKSSDFLGNQRAENYYLGVSELTNRMSYKIHVTDSYHGFSQAVEVRA